MPTEQPVGVDPAQFRKIEFEYYIIRPRLFLLDFEGTPMDGGPWDVAAANRSLHGKRELFDSRIESRRVRILSLPLYKDGRLAGSAQLAANLEYADQAVANLGRVLILLLPLALLLTGMAGVWLTRRALRPVGEFADAAGRIGAANFSGRMPVIGTDEFAHLGSVFNSMLDRLETAFRSLEDAYKSQRQFVADASHELKTPLTAMRTRLGIASQKVQTPDKYVDHLDSLTRSTDKMSSIVSDLLLLARADERMLLGRRRLIPVGSLAEEAASIIEDAYGCKIDRQVENDLKVSADADGLSRVLTNLLDNAARHTPKDGSIILCAVERGQNVVIQVEDTGSGIPADHLPHVFDRFYRVDASRERGAGGTGLGLALVKAIVEAHHGTVSIASEVSRGTTVTIKLPSGR
jgi:signal transduction histidine kinase